MKGKCDIRDGRCHFTQVVPVTTGDYDLGHPREVRLLVSKTVGETS